MGDDVLKVDPPKTVFAGTMKAAHDLTNSGATKLAVKVKVSHPQINIAKPFLAIEPGQTAKMNVKCTFGDGGPDPTQTYAIGIMYADAPAEMGSDVESMKTAWASIASPKTIRLAVEFQAGGEAPAADAAADAAADPACGGQ